MQNSYSDILNFSVSIPLKMGLEDLFSQENPSYVKNTEYVLRGVVCFIGAHYMTYIKQITSNGIIEWRLYDDQNPIKSFENWVDILYYILTLGQQPTLLLYEKLSRKNNQYDINEQLSYTELYSIQKKADDLQSFIDDFEKQQMDTDTSDL